MDKLGYAQPTLSDLEMGYEVDVYENGLIGVEVGTDASGEMQYIVLEPGSAHPPIRVSGAFATTSAAKSVCW